MNSNFIQMIKSWWCQRNVTFDESPAQTTEGTEVLDLSHTFEELSIASEDSDAFEEGPEQEADTGEATVEEVISQEATLIDDALLTVYLAVSRLVAAKASAS